MKAKLQARIRSATKLGGDAILVIDTPVDGKVDTTVLNAKGINLTGEIRLKSLIADQIKLGATLTITISDEEPDEGSNG